MTAPLTRRRAVAELILAGALWGFGFVATIWALESLRPGPLLFLRYLLATAAGEALWWIGSRRSLPAWRSDFRLAAPGGFLLAGFVLPQTVGLLTTSAGQSGFLTAFYVILVPLLNHLFFGVRPGGAAYLHAALALGGVALLAGTDLGTIAPGDLWTLLCALVAAIHIVYLDRVSRRIVDPFRFNTFQSLFAGLAALPFVALTDGFEALTPTLSGRAWLGLLSLALGSSVVAFTIQVRSQRVLPATTASMLFLLEAPFALLFGLIFLNEGFGLRQGLGALLIFTAAMRSSARAGSR